MTISKLKCQYHGYGIFLNELCVYLSQRKKKKIKLTDIWDHKQIASPEVSILLTSCLTAIKFYVIKYCTTVYERNGKKNFWAIKNSGEIINKLKSSGFLASCLSTHDFSTLYTTLPHNLFQEKLTK